MTADSDNASVSSKEEVEKQVEKEEEETVTFKDLVS